MGGRGAPQLWIDGIHTFRTVHAAGALNQFRSTAFGLGFPERPLGVLFERVADQHVGDPKSLLEFDVEALALVMNGVKRSMDFLFDLEGQRFRNLALRRDLDAVGIACAHRRHALLDVFRNPDFQKAATPEEI